MDLETKKVLRSLNGFDVAFTEKRCLYILYPKRKSQANLLRYRVVYNIDDILRLPKEDELTHLLSYRSLHIKISHYIFEEIRNRCRTVVYLPSGKSNGFNTSSSCFIDIVNT